MSYYQDEEVHRRRSTKKTKERRPPNDYNPDPYNNDYRGARETSLVRRPRDDSFSSVEEEVKRDFPPSGYSRRTRARSVGERDRYGDSYDRGSYYDDGYASSKHGSKRHQEKGRPRRRDSYSDSSVSRSPPRRRKSMGEQALAALGLGGVAAAAAAGKNRDRSHSRSRRRRDSSSSSARSRSKRGRGKPQSKEEVAKALKAALIAGATEAVRSRKEPGGWAGPKGKRVLTAAITAGGVKELIDHNSEKDSKFKTVGSVLAGLGTNRLVNGSRSRSRSRARGRDGRGRARSESRSRLKELAGAGLITAAGKSIYDRVRSKSRGRRSRSSSFDSYDSRSPPGRREKKKRSSSISAFASKGLAALGLGEAADKRHKHRSATFDDDDYYYHDDYRRGRNGVPPPYGGGGYSDPRDVGQPRSVGNGDMLHKDANGVDLSPRHFGDSKTESDSDLGSSSDDQRRLKKARTAQMITAGLTTVAMIHAGHSVYQSMEARGERIKAVADGDITPKQARREKNKNHLQDAVSVGIAALGIKGAVSEWKEMKEKHQTAVELKKKQERHRQKREARRRKLLSMGMQDRFAGSAPTLASYDNAFPAAGPTYIDANPYDATHYPPAAYPPPYIPPPPPGPPPASS